MEKIAIYQGEPCKPISQKGPDAGELSQLFIMVGKVSDYAHLLALYN